MLALASPVMVPMMKLEGGGQLVDCCFGSPPDAWAPMEAKSDSIRFAALDYLEHERVGGAGGDWRAPLGGPGEAGAANEPSEPNDTIRSADRARHIRSARMSIRSSWLPHFLLRPRLEAKHIDLNWSAHPYVRFFRPRTALGLSRPLSRGGIFGRPRNNQADGSLALTIQANA